jgi:predicted MFS family arabinose efflux permease
VSWRAVYLVSAGFALALGGLLLRALPPPAADRPARRIGYGELVRSTLALYATQRTLRARAALALLVFATSNVLWAPLALALSAPPRALSHQAIGLFGLVGVAGALGAARAGRRADHGQGRQTTGAALAAMLLCWLPIALLRHSLVALVVGLVVLDLAVQAVHVTSQSVIQRIDPAARSRLVGAYMVPYAIGSAAGGVASTATYAWAGWGGVCLLGAALSGAALAVWAACDRTSAAGPPAGARPPAPVAGPLATRCSAASGCR